METHTDELQCEVDHATFVDALSFVDRELANYGASADVDAALPSLSLFDDIALDPQQQQLHAQHHHHHHHLAHHHHIDDTDVLQLLSVGSDSHGSSIDLLALEAFTAATDSRTNCDANDTSDFPIDHTRSDSSATSELVLADNSNNSNKRNKQSQQELVAPSTAPKRRARPSLSSSSTPSSTTSTGSSRTKKPLNYNPNKARDERREELIYLRQKVLELESQLDTMQAKRPRLTAPQRASSLTNTTTSNRLPPNNSFKLETGTSEPLPLAQQQLVLTSMWHDIATRQAESRIKAERENIRLRLVVENQLKIAKSLEKLLQRKAATRSSSTSDTNDTRHCVQCQQLHRVYPPTKDPRTDAQIYEDLAAGVAQAYDEVDAVFTANGLGTMEVPFSDARMRTADSDEMEGSSTTDAMQLEILATKVLPFDVQATATAAWHYLSYAKQRTPSRSYFFDAPKTTDTTDDTITENFSLGLHANSTSAHFRVKQIVRRFVEDERVVIVWRSFVEPVEFSDEPLSDLRFSERGYIVIKRPMSLAAAACAVVQTCYIFTPNFTGSSAVDAADHQHPKVGAITDFVLSATAANIASSHEMIENVLLQQALMRETTTTDVDEESDDPEMSVVQTL